MPGFENYREEASRIEQEIVRRGIVLGIDWEDEATVRLLAREALAARGDRQDIGPAKLELFGLAQLMLKVMTQSAEDGYEIHGGVVWKAFGRALWVEAGLKKQSAA